MAALLITSMEITGRKPQEQSKSTIFLAKNLLKFTRFVKCL